MFPGSPGKLPALVKVGGKSVSGAKAVENPTEKELLLEAPDPVVGVSGSLQAARRLAHVRQLHQRRQPRLGEGRRLQRQRQRAQGARRALARSRARPVRIC
ncbi:MAG: hypothetical protein QM756_03715 [Polyangiaceae bacterium]